MILARLDVPPHIFIHLLPLAVKYKVELYDPRTGGFMPSSLGMGMHVEVRDPDDKMILSRVYSSEGRISFTSHTPGEHIICLYSNSSSWFSGTQLVREHYPRRMQRISVSTVT